MAFAWDDYRTLAEQLRQQEDEAAQRSAISRLYYAVFCQSRNYLLENGFNISGMGPGTHRQVWDEFLKRGRSHKPIGIEGNRLHYYRVRADYEDAVTRLDALVKDSFRLAGNILHYLNQVKNAGPKPN